MGASSAQTKRSLNLARGCARSSWSAYVRVDGTTFTPTTVIARSDRPTWPIAASMITRCRYQDVPQVMIIRYGSHVRHFGYLTPGQDESLFDLVPQPFGRESDRGTLAVALGATLYTPGTAVAYAARIGALAGLGLISAVLCLEDAIRDTDVADAERNVIAQLA